MADDHGAHQTGDAYVVSMCEDFCKSPTAPVGYMISQTLDRSVTVTNSVRALTTPMLNLDSRICAVTGNEAGVGGGVVSGVNIGMCKPVLDYAATVRAQGQPLLRHDTVMEMNCCGPDGPGNTLGRIVYIAPEAANDGGADQFKEVGGDEPLFHPETKKRPTTPAGSHVLGPDKSTQIPVYKTPLKEGHGGFYSVDKNGPFIVVNSSGSVQSQGLSLEHEYTHAEQDYRNRLPGEPDFDGKCGDTVANEIEARNAEIAKIESDPNLTPEQKKRAKERVNKGIGMVLGKDHSERGLKIKDNYCKGTLNWEKETGKKSPYSARCKQDDGYETF